MWGPGSLHVYVSCQSVIWILVVFSGHSGSLTAANDQSTQITDAPAPDDVITSPANGGTDIAAVTMATENQPSVPQKTCRYWDGHIGVTTYRYITCGHCYTYMYPDNGIRVIMRFPSVLIAYNTSVFPQNYIIVPDITNQTVVDKICQTLNQGQSCRKWQQCCHAADECCEEQQASRTAEDPDQIQNCPATWDGYACWPEYEAGHVAEESCPEYIPLGVPKQAYKTCTENGTWYKKLAFPPDYYKEWTDFTKCLNIDGAKVGIFIKVGCDVLSLGALIPSLVIFLHYRTLRKQHRVRLHIHLFCSFVLYAVINMLWELVVVYGKLNHPSDRSEESLMDRNADGCKILYVLTRYANSCTYMWMLCEGFYLHRLIVKAFTPPKRLIFFYLFGWGFPWIPVAIYSIIRIFIQNTLCWVNEIGGLEWLIYTPNFIALAANLVFLIDILRILLTQLQSHPNEPSNYRRALKATFVLIPLFGLQLFLVIYRPHDPEAMAIYEKLAAVVVNTQGFFVAVIFCFVNGEVHSNVKRSCGCDDCCVTKRHPHAEGNYTMTTQASDVYSKTNTSFQGPGYTNGGSSSGNKADYMAMEPVKENGYVE